MSYWHIAFAGGAGVWAAGRWLCCFHINTSWRITQEEIQLHCIILHCKSVELITLVPHVNKSVGTKVLPAKKSFNQWMTSNCFKENNKTLCACNEVLLKIAVVSWHTCRTAFFLSIWRLQTDSRTRHQLIHWSKFIKIIMINNYSLTL